MNMMTKLEAERLERSSLRDELSAERLKNVKLEGRVQRTLWQMDGLCNVAEKAGVDVSYWRAIVAQGSVA